ncbi:MAG: amidotransferase, partial [Pseudomonadales bacterium]|nr:amidotransferase [Pseudomonadales bacterium]
DTVDCDGYVITGSKHSVYEDLPWIPPLIEFLKKVRKARRKVVGICFGHQLIAHYFGGETTPAACGWVVGVQDTRLLTEESWMKPARQSVGMLSSHKDQVSRLPDGARLIASSGSCPIAGFVIEDDIMTLQGHPEFVKAYSASLMDFRREVLGERVYRKGIESLAENTDEAVVARWMLNFMAG